MTLPTKGNQVAGVPKHILNLMLGYDNGVYYGSLAEHIVGKQYGDMTNEQSIPGYGILDLSLGYRIPYVSTTIKKPTVRLSVNNLLNKDYLSGVDSNSFSSKKHTSNGNTYKAKSPRYLVGEERFFEVSLEASF